MDTLGSLCDKLTIVKLKQWHCKDPDISKSLGIQSDQIIYEINCFVSDALKGDIPKSMLKFESHKIGGRSETAHYEDIGSVFSALATINCDIWHDVDKSYHIDDYPEEDKSKLMKRLSRLNLDRNFLKEEIDDIFSRICS